MAENFLRTYIDNNSEAKKVKEIPTELLKRKTPRHNIVATVKL